MGLAMTGGGVIARLTKAAEAISILTKEEC